ncbi:MAG: hypothetical protein QGH40_03945, partial [bacterium]|nr:hypothetical protein [bacterium]
FRETDVLSGRMNAHSSWDTDQDDIVNRVLESEAGLTVTLEITGANPNNLALPEEPLKTISYYVLSDEDPDEFGRKLHTINVPQEVQLGGITREVDSEIDQDTLERTLTYVYNFNLPDTVADGPVAITYNAVDNAGNASGLMQDPRLLTVVERPVFTQVALFNLRGERIFDNGYDLSPIYKDGGEVGSGSYWSISGNKYYNLDPREDVSEQWIKAAAAEASLGTAHAAVLLVRSTRALPEPGRRVDTTSGQVTDLIAYDTAAAASYSYGGWNALPNKGIIDPNFDVPVHTYYALLNLNGAEEGASSMEITAFTNQYENNEFAYQVGYGSDFTLNRGYDKDGVNSVEDWEKQDAFFYVDTGLPEVEVLVYAWKNNQDMYQQGVFNTSAASAVKLHPEADSPTGGYLLKHEYQVWDDFLQVYREAWTPVEKPSWWPNDEGHVPAGKRWSSVSMDELGVSGATIEVAVRITVTGANPDRNALEKHPLDLLEYFGLEDVEKVDYPDTAKVDTSTTALTPGEIARVDTNKGLGWMYDYVFALPRDIADYGVGAKLSLTDNAGNSLSEQAADLDIKDNPLFKVAEKPRFELVKITAPAEDTDVWEDTDPLSAPVTIGTVTFPVYLYNESYPTDMYQVSYANSPDDPDFIEGKNLKPVKVGEDIKLLIRSNRRLRSGGGQAGITVAFPNVNVAGGSVSPVLERAAGYQRNRAAGIYRYYYEIHDEGPPGAGRITVPGGTKRTGLAGFDVAGYVWFNLAGARKVHTGYFFVDDDTPEVSILSIKDDNDNFINEPVLAKQTTFDTRKSQPISFRVAMRVVYVNPDSTELVSEAEPFMHPLVELNLPVRTGENYVSEMVSFALSDPDAFSNKGLDLVWEDILTDIDVTKPPLTAGGAPNGSGPYEYTYHLTLPENICLGDGDIQAKFVVVDNAGNCSEIKYETFFKVSEKPTFQEIAIRTSDEIEHATWRGEEGSPNLTPLVYRASRSEVIEETLTYDAILETLGYNTYTSLPVDMNAAVVYSVMRTAGKVKSVSPDDTLDITIDSNRRLEVGLTPGKDARVVFEFLDDNG